MLLFERFSLQHGIYLILFLLIPLIDQSQPHKPRRTQWDPHAGTGRIFVHDRRHEENYEDYGHGRHDHSRFHVHQPRYSSSGGPYFVHGSRWRWRGHKGRLPHPYIHGHGQGGFRRGGPPLPRPPPRPQPDYFTSGERRPPPPDYGIGPVDIELPLADRASYNNRYSAGGGFYDAPLQVRITSGSGRGSSVVGGTNGGLVG